MRKSRVVEINPGAGKSRAARKALAVMTGPRTILVDTHVLAAQTRSALKAEHGIEAEHHGGVLAPIEGREGCAYPERVALLQEAGLSAGRYACAKCPRRDKCDAREPVGTGDVRIGVHAMAGAEALSTPNVVIDEEPIELVRKVEISQATIDAALRGLQRCDQEYLHLMYPWISIWIAVLKGSSPADAARRIMLEDFETALRWANTRFDPALGTRVYHHRVDRSDDAFELARRIADVADLEPGAMPPKGRVVHEQQADGSIAAVGLPWFASVDSATFATWATETKALKDLRATARRDAVISGTTARMWSEALQLFANGGTLLSATPTMSILRKVAPDLEHKRFRVPDAHPTTRVMVDVSEATTGHLKGDAPKVRRLVDDALRRARAFGTGRVVIFCPKAISDVVRSAAGPEVDVATYGSTRGLDRWMDFQTFVSIGDHFQEKIANQEEAEFFGVDPAELWIERVEGELCQVHGRARDPSRSSPCLHLHYGRVWPKGWHHGIADVEKGPQGRPRGESSLSPDALQAAVTAIGSVKAAAVAWGLPRSTLRRYLAGEAPIPADVASRVTG